MGDQHHSSDLCGRNGPAGLPDGTGYGFPVTEFDVIVVGGGPAGSAATTMLARAGQRVLLVDKASFPRDKCCGDGLTAGALRRLQALGLDPARIPSWTWVDDFVLSTPRRREVRFPLPVGDGRFAAIAMRVELDAELLALARHAGATVREATALTSLSFDADGVHCSFETARAPAAGEATGPAATPSANATETVPSKARAAFVIAADGMWSTTRKLLSVQTTATTPTGESYLGEWHGYRQYASNVTTPASKDLWIWFEKDLVPGYLWSFPLAGNRVNVGFGIERDRERPTKEMKTLWPQLLARPHVRAVLGDDAVLEDSPKAWPIPAAVTHAPLAIGRVLFAGDAARACDVLTGEGIGQALQTGMAAAACIASNPRNDPTAPGRRYAERMIHELGPDHSMAASLQKLMSNSSIAETAIRISGSSAWTRRNFARWLFEDYPRGIALTPSRWRWGLLNGSGAFHDE
jgi:menaquinone-9 beta-reductase